MTRISLVFTLLLLALPATASAAVSTTHSGWLWGSPEPQGHDLYAIDLKGNPVGYASGAFGTLLATTDEGGSWSSVRTGLTLDLHRLEMIDADSVIVGSPCALRRTDNAGKTFRRLPFTTSERRCGRPVTDLSFPTPEAGFVLLADGGVLKTTDGGNSFSALTSFPAGGGAATALAFSTAQTGIAVTVGGNVYRTTDGGATWTLEYDGSVRLNAAFVSGPNAVAVGDHATFLWSTDRGDNWAQPATEADAPARPNVNFSSVRCVPVQTTCLMATDGRKLVRTADAGRSFEEVPATANAADFASPARAVAVGPGGLTQLSNDGGRTWGVLGSSLPPTPSLFRIRATSASVAHAVGLSEGIARTTDGGETWRVVGVPTGAPVRDVSFPTASVGFALDQAGGVARTDDGGQTWSLLDAETPEPPQAIYAAGSDVVLLIGPRGMYRSTDGGETFAPHRHRIVRVRTLNEADRAGSSIMVFGPRVIAVSSNRGATWRRIVRPTQSAEVLAADFTSAKAGYVVETDGRVYSTRDGGRTWTELPGVGHADIRQIAMGDSRSGWVSLAGGPGSTVLRTNDAGRSWRPQLIGSGGVPVLAAPTARTGFASPGGFGSHLLFTQAGGDAGPASSITISTPAHVLPRRQEITIRGRLRPATGGEQVAVRVRPLRGSRWRELPATVASDGAFSVDYRVRNGTVFVAQWAGDPDSAGDGSQALVVRIDRRR